MTTNNGIRGYIMENEIYTNDGNTLSFAQDTFSVFYQKQKYFTGNKVKILRPKFERSHSRIMQYITGCLQKTLRNFSWGTGSTVESISEFKFKLPIKNGKIDFDFMESFIAELEAQRIAELEAYLSLTGLKNTDLTFEEEQALHDLKNIYWKKFYLIDVFTVKNTRNILSRDIIENSGTVPYLCAGSENNSVSSYISYKDEYLDKGNCIFIGGKTFVVTYQKDDFFSNDSHNLSLYLKDIDKCGKDICLYLVTCIYKSLNHKYSWGNSISNKKIQKDMVYLPVKNNNIDYKYMKLLISAVQKLVIKDVVAYSDNKISMTKTVVEKHK